MSIFTWVEGVGGFVVSEKEVLFVFSEEDGVTCVCVYVEFLARLWGPSPKLVGYIKERWRSKMPIVEMFLGISFYLQHGIVGGVCNLVISVDCSLNYSHHKYNTKHYNRAKEIE